MSNCREAYLGEWVSEPEAVGNDFEALVRQHAGLLFQLAYSVVRNHHDAEDVVQEAFMRALRHRKELQTITNPRAWLARVSWRLALSRRRRLPEVSLESISENLRELYARGASADQLASDAQMASILDALICALPQKLREPLLLSAIEELGTCEIAEILNIPPASVRTRLLRARQLLKEKLAALLEARRGPRQP